MSDRAKRAFTGNIKSSIFGTPAERPQTVNYGTPAERRQSVLIAKRDLFRLFYKRFAAEGHELRCQIEDEHDTRPITEGHAEGYDQLVAWLNRRLQEIDKQIATD